MNLAEIQLRLHGLEPLAALAEAKVISDQLQNKLAQMHPKSPLAAREAYAAGMLKMACKQARQNWPQDIAPLGISVVGRLPGELPPDREDDTLAQLAAADWLDRRDDEMDE